MGAIASQITSLTIVYPTDYSGAYQSKHQSSASLAFVRGIHRGPVNSSHKWPVTRKMSPFDDVIMVSGMANSKFLTLLRDTHNWNFSISYLQIFWFAVKSMDILTAGTDLKTRDNIFVKKLEYELMALFNNFGPDKVDDIVEIF